MKLILFAAAARLAAGDDFCVPAACRKLAPGAEDEHSMKNLVGDLECCAPRERAGCADGYRYATRGKCTSGPCEEYATCCVHCVDGEACARVDAARFGQTARRDCGSDDANYIRVWIVMAVMSFVASIGLLVCLFAQYHRSEQQRRLQVKRDTHAPARKFSLAVVELLPPDLERGATPRVEARSLEPPVGETRGPSVWDPDGDPRGAYAVPACPQCLTPCRCAPKACSEQDPCHAIGGHVAAPEAESMAREEELSRSTPPDCALAATPSAPPDGDLEAATQAAYPRLTADGTPTGTAPDLEAAT
ncbi:unnamed protein product [Pelagomonas calceolata]|uniref:SREBP regulating gene protein n=1 Tax=Pelagomonas calceolata TaxID=35677 RepID=A0A8J2SC58_9STRA|nr:unnamed protein product [Pelagomonas calceolata]